MKQILHYILFFLFIILVCQILSSCSKEHIEALDAISWTQKRIINDDITGEYLGTKLVIHYHLVTEQARIVEYMNLPKAEPFCNDMNDTLVTIIARPCSDKELH